MLHKTEGPVVDFSAPMDYDALTEYIRILSERYPRLECGGIGATVAGRSIPVLSLGNPQAAKSVLYVGGVGAGDYPVAAVLLRFVNDYFEFLQSGRRMYSVSLPYLYERRRIYVVPMLNCDGCSLRLNDGDPRLPESFRERLVRMNGGSESFSGWEANARGVDLRRNFPVGKAGRQESGEEDGASAGYSGIAPESEPETAALCNAVRIYGDVAITLRLHMDDDALLCVAGDPPVPRARTLGRLLSRMSGVALREAEEADGATEWYAEEFRRPAFSIGCRYRGLEDSPDDYIKIYAFLKETLFSAPLLA